MKKLAIGLYVAADRRFDGLGVLPGDLRCAHDAMQGEIFRIIFYHVPSASVAFLFFAVSLAGSIGFLGFRRNSQTGRRLPTPGRWPGPRWGWCSAPWC